jgi:hypothetical protein
MSGALEAANNESRDAKLRSAEDFNFRTRDPTKGQIACDARPDEILLNASWKEVFTLETYFNMTKITWKSYKQA